MDGQIVEAGGPQQLAIKTIHPAFRQWLCLGAARFVCIPTGLVKRIVKLGDHVFKGPINTASFDRLTRNNITEDRRLWQSVKVVPQALAPALAAHPSLPAHRIYARLFFLLPLLRYSLAFVWLATAVITAFIAPRNVTFGLFA